MPNTFKQDRGSFLARHDAASSKPNIANPDSNQGSVLNNRFDNIDISDKPYVSKGASASFKVPATSSASAGGDRDWMNFASTQSRAPMDRPTTASNSNARV